MKRGRVVQLVRTLACHARGRGFEPHLGRHHAAMAQMVERILGKDEVISSILISSSKSSTLCVELFCCFAILCVFFANNLKHYLPSTRKSIYEYMLFIYRLTFKE